jgi:hypothetical protein
MKIFATVAAALITFAAAQEEVNKLGYTDTVVQKVDLIDVDKKLKYGTLEWVSRNWVEKAGVKNVNEVIYTCKPLMANNMPYVLKDYND